MWVIVSSCCLAIAPLPHSAIALGHRLGHARLAVALGKAVKFSHPAARLRVAQVFAAEQAKRHRRIRQQGNLLTVATLQHGDFPGAVEQAVGVLHADHARQLVFTGGVEKLHQPPWPFVGQADVADLALVHQLGQRLQGFPWRGERALLGRIVEKITKHRRVALRPVQLIKIDVVGLQPAQRAFYCCAQIGAGEGMLAIANPWQATAGAGGLGGHYHLGAILTGQPVANNGFGGVHGIGARRHRVHLGGVDEIHPAFNGEVQLGVAFSLGVLLAKGHGAQTNGGNLQRAARKGAVVHDGS